MKRNSRVKFVNRVGTVVANPYRHYNKGSYDKYCEVLFDDTGYIESILIESLEVL